MVDWIQLKTNNHKAKLIYDEIDRNKAIGFAKIEDRSLMNRL